MAELKTKESKVDVLDFIDKLDYNRKEEAIILLKIFKETTGENPKIWGDSIIGFGKIHYKSERSSQEGDWFCTGFSPRKKALSLYIMSGIREQKELLKKLGKHKTGVGCLYINKLEDVNIEILRKIIKNSYFRVKETGKFC